MPQKPKPKRNNKDKYPCRLCTASFAYAGKLADHVKDKHPDPIAKEDLVQLDSNPKIDGYEEIEFDNGSYTCNECGYSCTSASTITQHVDAVHRKMIATECHICGKQFHYKHALKRHMYLHTEMPHHCEFCGKGFPDRYKLFEVHMKKHHPQEYLQEMNSRKLNEQENHTNSLLGLPTMTFK